MKLSAWINKLLCIFSSFCRLHFLFCMIYFSKQYCIVASTSWFNKKLCEKHDKNALLITCYFFFLFASNFAKLTRTFPMLSLESNNNLTSARSLSHFFPIATTEKTTHCSSKTFHIQTIFLQLNFTLHPPGGFPLIT